MHSKGIFLIVLSFMLCCCSMMSTPGAPMPIQNPTLPSTWTPVTSFSTVSPKEEASEIETELATQDVVGETASSLTATAEAGQLQSPISTFTGGDQWLVTFPGVSSPYLASTNDGGFLLLGLLDNHDGDRQNILFRLNSQGEIIWERILQPGYFHGLLEVGDGGILLVFTQSLTKLDAEGNIEWQEYLSYDQDRSPFISSFYDFQSSKTQSNGQVLMIDKGSINAFDYEGSFNSQRAILSAAREGRTSTWLTTQAKWTAGQENNSGFWVMREAAFTSSWLRMFDFAHLGIAIHSPETHVVGTRDGGAVLVAAVRNLISPTFTIWIVRLDSFGNILWQTAVEGAEEADLKVQETVDGGFIIASNAGYWGRELFGSYLRLLRIDASGGMLWDQFIGDGKWRVRPKAILDTIDRGHLLAGEVIIPGDQLMSDAGDVFLLKIDQDGVINECPWFQPAPFGPPVDTFPLSTINIESNTPFSTAVIRVHSYHPQNLGIKDGFDQFSAHCVFPPVEAPTSMPSYSTPFVITPAPPAVLENGAIHIIALANGTILGSSQGENWLPVAQPFDSYGGSISFQLYGWNGKQGNAQGTIRRAKDSGVCPDLPTIAFFNQPEDLDSIAFAADWNAQPRRATQINPSVTSYRGITMEYLKAAGISQPEVHIDSIAKVDLEGDGLEEVILSASWYEGGSSNRGVEIDDYSVVFLRRIINGEVVTLPMIHTIYKSVSGATIPVVYNIAAILDLNGDGVLEIILRGSSGAGTEYLVYSPTFSLERPVLQINCVHS